MIALTSSETRNSCVGGGTVAKYLEFFCACVRSFVMLVFDEETEIKAFLWYYSTFFEEKFTVSALW
jgi:hypothetical protein